MSSPFRLISIWAWSEGAASLTAVYFRLLIGNEDDGSDDWWQEYEA